MKLFKTLFYLAGIALCASSCVSARSVRYLADMQEFGEVDVDGKFEAKICPSDELSIIVMPNADLEEQELIKPFNRFSNGMGGPYQRQGYLVDVDGYIQFPVFGKMKVTGMTCRNLRDSIEYRLKNEGYLSDPIVEVRITNYKIYFLGSQGGRVLNVDNERCTFLEALAMAGDLNLYTKRDKIGIVREKEGKMVVHYLDPRSSDVFNDEFFLLQQNDIVLTESMTYIFFQEWMSNIGTFLSAVSTITSAAAVVIATKALIEKK